MSAPEPYIERDGRFWQVVFPAVPNEGFDLCTGPHWTRLGARLSLWFWTWPEGPMKQGKATTEPDRRVARGESQDGCPLCDAAIHELNADRRYPVGLTRSEIEALRTILSKADHAIGSADVGVLDA